MMSRPTQSQASSNSRHIFEANKVSMIPWLLFKITASFSLMNRQRQSQASSKSRHIFETNKDSMIPWPLFKITASFSLMNRQRQSQASSKSRHVSQACFYKKITFSWIVRLCCFQLLVDVGKITFVHPNDPASPLHHYQSVKKNVFPSVNSLRHSHHSGSQSKKINRAMP